MVDVDRFKLMITVLNTVNGIIQGLTFIVD